MNADSVQVPLFMIVSATTVKLTSKGNLLAAVSERVGPTELIDRGPKLSSKEMVPEAAALTPVAISQNIAFTPTTNVSPFRPNWTNETGWHSLCGSQH